jgi:hypothetical protein
MQQSRLLEQLVGYACGCSCVFLAFAPHSRTLQHTRITGTVQQALEAAHLAGLYMLVQLHTPCPR